MLESPAPLLHQSLEALREGLAQRVGLVGAVDVLLTILQPVQEVCVVLVPVLRPTSWGESEST